MNYVSIDPSIISTGMVVNGHVFNYCRASAALNKNQEYTKWFDLCKHQITYKYIELSEKKDYSENEVHKIKLYDAITTGIVRDITSILNKDVPTKIAMEGYSYSSTGDIIDLVTFSTLLRTKLLNVTDDLKIVSPRTLKSETCKLVYEPKNIGIKKPKLEYRNKNGVPGGSFTKIDMCQALIDYEINDPYCNMIKENSTDILSNKTIKKPLEDCNDAYLLYILLKKGKI